MIKKEIIIHKPVIQLPVNYGYYPKRLSKEEYEKLLEESKFKVGDIIALGSAGLTTLNGFNFVVDIQKDSEKVGYRQGNPNDDPCYLRVLSYTEYTTNPYLRWTTPIGYRTPTNHELENLIKPNHDKLQNYYNEWQKRNS